MKENKLKKLNYELLELYKKSMPILIRSWKNESKGTDRNVKKIKSGKRYFTSSYSNS